MTQIRPFLKITAIRLIETPVDRTTVFWQSRFRYFYASPEVWDPTYCVSRKRMKPMQYTMMPKFSRNASNDFGHRSETAK